MVTAPWAQLLTRSEGPQGGAVGEKANESQKNTIGGSQCMSRSDFHTALILDRESPKYTCTCGGSQWGSSGESGLVNFLYYRVSERLLWEEVAPEGSWGFIWELCDLEEFSPNPGVPPW